MGEQSSQELGNFKYDAFISYRRSDGTPLARWLRSRLLSYSLPKSLRPGKQEKLNIYLDTVYERATEDFFSQNIEPSLQQSRFLIVISTPDALQQRPDVSPNWVYREVETFCLLPQGKNILVGLAKGEVYHPLPGDLIERFPRIEIIDFRTLGFARFIWWPKLWRLSEELLKIVAPLYDIKVEDMPLLRLEESRRSQRNLWLTVIFSFILFATMTGLFIWSFLSLASARQQLIRTHLLQGQDLFIESPAHARLHFAEAVRIADSSVVVRVVSWAEGLGAIDLGLRNDYAKARLWLGQWKDKPIPQVAWHRLGVKSVDFSPDGRRFATVSVLGEAQVWDVTSGQLIGKRVDDWPYASLVKFSPNGQRFIVLSTTTFLTRLWNAETGEPAGPEMVHNGPVTSASFHPGGQVLVTSSGLGYIFFWNAMTGERLREPLAVGEDARLITFSPDGRLFAVVTYSNAVQIWDYVEKRLIARVVEHKRDVTNYGLIASFSPDSQRLVLAIGDNAVQQIDPLTGKPLGATFAHSGAITSATYSPDGKRLLTSSADNTAQIWDAETGSPTSRLLRHNNYVLDAAFSPDGKLVVTAARDFTARVWDTVTGSPVGSVLQHAAFVYTARFSPDGTRIATTSEDGTVRLWETKSVARPIDFDWKIKSLALSPDGGRVLMIDEDKTLRVWKWPQVPSAGRDGRTISEVEEAVFSPDGKHVWLKNSHQEFYIWDYQEGKMHAMFDMGGVELKEGSFSSDLRRVVTKNKENTVQVWEAETGERFGKPIILKEADVFESSANGEILIVLHEDSSLEAFSVAEGKKVGQPFRFAGELDNTLCTPDGKFMWIVAKDENKNYSLLVWDTLSGKVLRRRPLAEKIWLRDFTSDGQWLVATADSYTAQVWNTATIEPVGKTMRHGYTINEAKFSPDGKLVLTVQGTNGQVWDALTGEPVGGSLKLNDYIISSVFSKDEKRVIIASQRQILVWDFPTDDTPAEALTLNAEVATAFTIDHTTGSIRMLSQEEWQRRKNSLFPKGRD